MSGLWVAKEKFGPYKYRDPWGREREVYVKFVEDVVLLKKTEETYRTTNGYDAEGVVG